MRPEQWQQLEAYMQDRMRDSAHDRQHVYRVLNNALEIARDEENVNLDVLLAAAILHDVGRADELVDPAADHAVTGGERAYQLLRQMGYEEAFAAHVRQCIRTHRFRRADPPASIEAKILFDADKLDVCGAIGIARTLMYAGSHGRPLYTQDENGMLRDGAQDTEDTFLREYRTKLEGMYGRFLTRRGAELAARRQAAARGFCTALLSEVEDNADTACAMLKQLVNGS
ncbi:MAG: HD domain-containing protein [Clostridiales bacterium]|nr:HD domain-containing protein [Clostridiales bacterium]